MAKPEYEDVWVKCKRCGGSGIDPVKLKGKPGHGSKGSESGQDEDQPCKGGCLNGMNIESHRKR